MWIGRILGAFLGLSKGGFLGLGLGFLIGFYIDNWLSNLIGKESKPLFNTGNHTNTGAQAQFFNGIFAVMGAIAKADGRVSEDEIAAASFIMDQMHLQGEERKKAIACFNRGKAASFNLQLELNQLKPLFRGRADLLVMFLEVQIALAYADGQLSSHEQRLLEQIRQTFGVSQGIFERIKQRVQAASAAQGSGSQTLDIHQAYAILGVRQDASDKEVKHAYRKLMSEHHPDKLTANGLPEEMREYAKEKTQQIQSAYEQIRKQRKPH